MINIDAAGSPQLPPRVRQFPIADSWQGVGSSNAYGKRGVPFSMALSAYQNRNLAGKH